MKIAMIGHKRIPSREGGVEIVVLELATRMVKQGHRVFAYNRRGKHIMGDNTASKKVKEYEGVRIVQVPTFENGKLNALVASFLATIFALFKRFDVIHYHAEGPCSMLFIPKLFGIRTVATIHGLDWQRGKWGRFASWYIKFGEKVAAKYADEVIVLSESVKQYFKETYNRDTTFIPNGITRNPLVMPDLIKTKYNLDKEEYILFLARIVPEKGIHYLIEAFKHVDTDKKLVIAGGSSHTDLYYNEICEMAKGDSRIIMTGFVQGREFEELMSNAFLYVLPSDVEGMPISLLEAMSYGNRCLVSDISENTSVIDRYGMSFQKGNSSDLQKKLELCCSQSYSWFEKEEIADYITSTYDWDEVVKKTIDLYQRKVRKKK